MPAQQHHIPQFGVITNPATDAETLSHWLTDSIPWSTWNQFSEEVKNNPNVYTVGELAHDLAQICSARAIGKNAQAADFERAREISQYTAMIGLLMQSQQSKAGAPLELSAGDTQNLADFFTAAEARIPDLRNVLKTGSYAIAYNINTELALFLDGDEAGLTKGHRKDLEGAPGGQEVLDAIDKLQETIKKETAAAPKTPNNKQDGDFQTALTQATAIIQEHANRPNEKRLTADSADVFVRSLPLNPS